MSIPEQLRLESARLNTRRHFLRECNLGLAGLWLASRTATAADARPSAVNPLAPRPPHFAARAKRVIYLHMSGGPSQLDLFDFKPDLARLDGQDCPQTFLEGKRFAVIQGVPKLLGPRFPFQRHGESGRWVSDRLPHLARHVDDLCFIHSMVTDQFNHAPAQLLLQTGSPLLGSACIGSWATYGLGTENENLPGFIVLTSGGKNPDGGKSLWGAGYLPSVYQGVQCRSHGDPVLYLQNPPGIDRTTRRLTLDAIAAVNRDTEAVLGDPETVSRVAQYELAFRMQIEAADAFDLSQEAAHVHAAYGTRPGAESFANNCLLARRLCERGVRFIQLYDWGWDSHGSSDQEALGIGFVQKCKDVDQPIAALLADLEARGLLEDTLVIWSGEFGRTPMQENRQGVTVRHAGRDHSPTAFTLWMAGGGCKAGMSYGQTDEIGMDVVAGKVTAHDFHATLLHLLGFDDKRLTYPFQGLQQRLSNVTKSAEVVHDVIA